MGNKDGRDGVAVTFTVMTFLAHTAPQFPLTISTKQRSLIQLIVFPHLSQPAAFHMLMFQSFFQQQQQQQQAAVKSCSVDLSLSTAAHGSVSGCVVEY